jgi:hypothetical protein
MSFLEMWVSFVGVIGNLGICIIWLAGWLE